MSDHIQKALDDYDYLLRHAVPVSVGVLFRNEEDHSVQFSGRIQDDERRQDHVLVPKKEYERLAAEIERLKEDFSNKKYEHVSGAVIIPIEQIDEVVEYASNPCTTREESDGAWKSLGILHIYRCEGCGGSGVGPMPGEDFISNVGQPAKCPACHGHRWTWGAKDDQKRLEPPRMIDPSGHEIVE